MAAKLNGAMGKHPPWLETPGCLAAANANNDGTIDLSDAVAIPGYLFLGWTELAYLSML